MVIRLHAVPINRTADRGCPRPRRPGSFNLNAFASNSTAHGRNAKNRGERPAVPINRIADRGCPRPRRPGSFNRNAFASNSSAHGRNVKSAANAVRFLLTAVRTAGVLARDAPGPLNSTRSRRIPPHIAAMQKIVAWRARTPAVHTSG